MTTSSPFEFSLGRKAIFSIHDAAGLQIECRLGTLWITQDGEYKDTILVPGQRFTTTKHGLVILNALSSSCVRISMNQDLKLTPKSSILGRIRIGKDVTFKLPLKGPFAPTFPCAT